MRYFRVSDTETQGRFIPNHINETTGENIGSSVEFNFESTNDKLQTNVVVLDHGRAMHLPQKKLGRT